MLKCVLNLGVRGDLPPTGGAAAAINVVLITDFHYHSARSYRPFLSRKSLRSSIGGWAPYCSTVGMFMSSTKIAFLLHGGAPSVVLEIFSSFSMIDYWVRFESV